MPNSRPLRVFLCHAKEDKAIVRELYLQLTAEGWLDVWLDEQKLLPGQNWDIEIEKAVEESDIVIVCLSAQAVTKEGYVQSEQSFVLDIARTKPEETIFVIPLRLDDCHVPRRLRTWQYLDYFPKSNHKWAYQRLLESLKLRANKLDIPVGRIDPSTSLRADALIEEDEGAKAERERKAKEEQARIAAQKMENDRIAREKAERERNAKEERDQIARQQANERKKVWTAAWHKINFKLFIAIGGMVIVLFFLFFIGKYVFQNLPVSPTPTSTRRIPTITPTLTHKSPTITPTSTIQPPTHTPTIAPPTFTPTPELSIGSTQISEKDGMVMVFVPAGEFSMGSNNRDRDEQPIHTVFLDSYWIDRTEVTNAMYAKCVDADACQPPSNTSSSTRSSYYGDSEFDNYPVIYVDWNKAKTYCEWARRRLPTESEWEKAARGMDERTYPWGNDAPTANLLNYYSNVGDTTKAGRYPKGAGPYGAYDMAGNVWEWVNDWYDSVYYNTSPSSNPLGPDTGQSRVLRGGSWDYNNSIVRSANRYRNSPGITVNLVGFRCARSP